MNNFYYIKNDLEKYAKDLEYRISILEKKLTTLPTNKLMYSRKNNAIQYYYRDPAGSAHYLQKKDDEKITALANAYYINKSLPKLKKNLTAAKKFLATHSGTEERDIFNSMPDELQQRNSNLFLYKKAYIYKWQHREYTRNLYKQEGLIHDTIRGEKVRSKSEAMIANALYNYDMPYLIETPLRLKSGKIIFPDFLILNPSTLEEVYWEHFGMMGDSVYAAEACKRIGILDSEGIKINNNLICTFETADAPLSSALIESNIKQCFFKNDK